MIACLASDPVIFFSTVMLFMILEKFLTIYFLGGGGGYWCQLSPDQDKCFCKKIFIFFLKEILKVNIPPVTNFF